MTSYYKVKDLSKSYPIFPKMINTIDEIANKDIMSYKFRKRIYCMFYNPDS